MATDTKGEPAPPRLTDTLRLETALRALKDATVNFYTARANLHDAKEAFEGADKELARARMEVQMLTRPNDNADIPWPFRELEAKAHEDGPGFAPEDGKRI